MPAKVSIPDVCRCIGRCAERLSSTVPSGDALLSTTEGVLVVLCAVLGALVALTPGEGSGGCALCNPWYDPEGVGSGSRDRGDRDLEACNCWLRFDDFRFDGPPGRCFEADCGVPKGGGSSSAGESCGDSRELMSISEVHAGLGAIRGKVRAVRRRSGAHKGEGSRQRGVARRDVKARVRTWELQAFRSFRHRGQRQRMVVSSEAPGAHQKGGQAQTPAELFRAGQHKHNNLMHASRPEFSSKHAAIPQEVQASPRPDGSTASACAETAVESHTATKLCINRLTSRRIYPRTHG